MTTDRDFDALLRSWFEASAGPAQPQDLAESVRAATAHSRPRPAWLVRLGGEPMPEVGRSGLNRLAVMGLSAAAVVAAIVLGISLVWRPSQNIGPKPEESPSPSHDERPSPHAASWTLTGSMLHGGDGHAAVLLPDGRVLALGELYDPTSGTWSSTGGPTQITGAATATLLVNGTVLVVGGGAETFDPRTNTWSSTGPMIAPRSAQTATRLLDGRVLVAGGMGPNSSYDYLASAEIYDPATRTWSATGSMREARGERGIGVLAGHTATLLANGSVLIAGGTAFGGAAISSAELYDPSSAIWIDAGTMSLTRAWHSVTLLQDGRVLIAGGETGGETNVFRGLRSAELYDPGVSAP